MTDATPQRKRRRPALSCVECRRRKIKCDRLDPCNHCKQTKNAVCVYKDVHPAVSKPSSSARPSQSLVSQTAKLDISSDNISLDTAYGNASSTTSPQATPASSLSDREGLGIASHVDLGEVNIDGDPNLPYRHKMINGGAPVLDSMTPSGQDLNDFNATVFGIGFATFNDLIVQDGEGVAQLRTKYFHHTDDTPLKDMKGTISKTRFFGESHWMHAFGSFHKLIFFKNKLFGGSETDAVNNDVRMLLEKCKQTARRVKAERPIMWHMNPNFIDYVPPREVSDKLVQHYLRAMEGTFRILHIPSFLREYEEYWYNPQKVPTTSIVKMLLVMAIGSCFYQGDGSASLREMAKQWVYSAQSWVAAPFEKARLNLSGLQLHCLSLLARQTNAVGGDLIWIAAGSLLRTAFQMGFHRDPKHFPKMSIMHGELRRRLWATVLELTVQASLDSGMPALITSNDFDTQPPANYDDEDITEKTLVLPVPKPDQVYTQTSVQIQLQKSLLTRLKVTNLINDFRSELNYEEVIRLGSELTNEARNANLIFSSLPTNSSQPPALQRYMLDLYVRRFLLALHTPFALKSQAQPLYYYSRKVVLDTAFHIISYPTNIHTPVMDDFTRLRCVGGGFYKETTIYATMLVCIELILQVEEELSSGMPRSQVAKATRQSYYKALEGMSDVFGKRIELGENNVKGHIFLNTAMAQIRALEDGEDVEQAIADSARRSARYCLDLLKVRAKLPETPEHVPEETLAMDQDFSYDFLMTDGSPPEFEFDNPDSWAYPGWEDNNALEF